MAKKRKQNATLTILYFIASVIFFLAVVFGCVTEKQRQRICKTCLIEQSEKDSSSVSVKSIPFDTLLWIKNHEGQEQEFINCDSLIAFLMRNQDTVITKKDGVKSTITRSKNKIKFKCETDSLKAIVELLKTEISTNKTKTIVKTVSSRCDKDHRNSFDGFCRWFFYIFGPLLGIYIFLRLKKIIP